MNGLIWIGPVIVGVLGGVLSVIVTINGSETALPAPQISLAFTVTL